VSLKATQRQARIATNYIIVNIRPILINWSPSEHLSSYVIKEQVRARAVIGRTPEPLPMEHAEYHSKLGMPVWSLEITKARELFN